MLIRDYGGLDAEATLDVFRRAIRVMASRDYSSEQIAAWAPGDTNITRWAARRAAAHTVVATLDDRVVGFTDLDESGYIDMMFVDPNVAGRGVATALMRWVVESARHRGIRQLTSHVSITARPFFETNGFEVIDERHPVLNGVTLTNFLMRRFLVTQDSDLG